MTTRDTTFPAADDPRVAAAACDYLAEREAGRRPDRRPYLDRCPEHAAELNRVLDGIDLMNRPSDFQPATGRELLNDAEPLPRQLGEYTLLREIGRGGMGVVYEAVQPALGRRVAVKVLPPRPGDDRRRRRFRHEAQAAAMLSHPNIVPVYAVGCDAGTDYFVMELIDGDSLDHILDDIRASRQSGPRSDLADLYFQNRTAYIRVIVDIVAQTADALDYAHRNGIVHRDIKPANILLDGNSKNQEPNSNRKPDRVWNLDFGSWNLPASGWNMVLGSWNFSPKVSDFGLAALPADGGLTKTGEFLGTLGFASPEQITGPRTGVDHRSDVFSLGVTLYELLTTRPAFDHSDPYRFAVDVCSREPAAVRSREPLVPRDLAAVLGKTLAKLPHERYATAAAMADDLRRVLAGEPVRAKPPTAVERLGRWLGRHPVAATGIAAVVLLALIGFGVHAALMTAEQAKTRARSAEADRRFRQARAIADEVYRVCQEDLADKPPLTGVRQRLLERVVGYYESFLEEAPDAAARAALAAGQDDARRVLAELAVVRRAERLMLVAEPAVLDDLGLTGESRATLRDGLSELRNAGRGGPRLTAAQLTEAVTRAEELTAATLTTAQWARLRQIDYQLRGPTVFDVPEVVAELRLTPDQRKLMRAAEAAMVHRLMRGGPPGRPPWDVWERERDTMLAALTDEQRQRFRALTGAAFRAPLGMMPPGPLLRRD